MFLITVYLDVILPVEPATSTVRCTVWKKYIYADCQVFHGSPIQPTPSTTCALRRQRMPRHACPPSRNIIPCLSRTAFGASVLWESTEQVVVCNTQQERMMTLTYRCATRPAKPTEHKRVPHRAPCKHCSASKCDTLRQRLLAR